MATRTTLLASLALSLATLTSGCGDDASSGAGGAGAGEGGASGEGAAAIAPGEACGSARVLTLSESGDGARSIVVTGSTTGMADDDTDDLSSCEGEGAPDGVYAFDGQAGEQVTIELTALDGSFLPILKLRGATHGCLDADDRCEDDVADGPLVIDWTVNEAGLTHVLVDGQNGTSGAFRLAIRVATP